MPVFRQPFRIAVSANIHNLNAVSGNQTLTHDLGKVPTYFRCYMTCGAESMLNISNGIYIRRNGVMLASDSGVSLNPTSGSPFPIADLLADVEIFDKDGNTIQTAYVSSMDATTIVLTWTQVQVFPTTEPITILYEVGG